MTMPCIVMRGTRPTFYFVPVTADLSDSVAYSQYPTTQTEVLGCRTIGMEDHTGMEDPEYRQAIIWRLLAFKELARDHWMHILEGVRDQRRRESR
jgi:hypothetical protein